MKLPHVRLTVRRMIAVVAVVGLLLGAERLQQRRAYFQQRATTHTQAESIYGRNLEFHRLQVLMGERQILIRERQFLSGVREARHRAEDFIAPKLSFIKPVAAKLTYEDSLVSNLPAQRDMVGRTERVVGYHAAMRIKYEGAAKHPWRSIGPDPQAYY